MANITTLSKDTRAGAATTTSSTYAAFLTIPAADIEASTDYIIFGYAKAKMDVDDVNSRVAMQVAAGGSEITGGGSPNHLAQSRENQSTDACPEFVFLYKYTSPGTPVDITLEHRNADNADTVTTHGAIAMVKLSDIGAENTAWFYSETATSTASTSAWKDRESITFTPSVQKDYVIIGLTKWQATNTTFSIQSRINIDATTFAPITLIEPQSTSEQQGLIVATVATLDATEHTIKQQVLSESGAAGNDTDFSTLFIFDTTVFDDYTDNYSETEIDPSSNDWNEVIRMTHTPAVTSNQFMFGYFIKDDNGTQASGSRMTAGGTAFTYGDNDPQEGASWDATDEIPVMLFGATSVDSGGEVIAIDYHPNEATTAARVEDNFLFAFGPLDLNGDGGPAADAEVAIPTIPTLPQIPNIR